MPTDHAAATPVDTPTVGPTALVALHGVERGPWWRRWGRLPAPGTTVDLVRSLHADRLNVVDDRTLELLGWIPREAWGDRPIGRPAPTGSVASVRPEPRPVIVIAIPRIPAG